MNNISWICSSELESEQADKYHLVRLQRHAEKADKNQAPLFAFLAKMYGKLNFYLLPPLFCYESIRKVLVNLEYTKLFLKKPTWALYRWYAYEDIW